MTKFPPIFAFLQDLRQNNNHEWFAAHRPEYEEATALFQDFVQGLIFRFDAALPLGDLAAKDVIFRIGSDMRFAKNLAALQKPLLRRACIRHSLRLPYYIHIMPTQAHFLAGGAHMPTSADLRGRSPGNPGAIPVVLTSPRLQTL